MSVLDLSPDVLGMIKEEMCLSCLKSEGLYCEKHHQEYFLVHYPDPDDDVTMGEAFMHTCLLCSLARALAVPPEKYKSYEALLSTDHNSGMFLLGFESICEITEVEGLDPERRLIFGAVLMSDLMQSTVEETVTDLLVYGSGSARN